VQAIALGKAEEVCERLQSELKGTSYCIIGADTVVTMNSKIYGKPKDAADAFNMLSELNGKGHVVYTGCVLKFNDKVLTFAEHTKVFFGKLTEEQIRGYVDTKEPLDKAGSYGIQGIGGCLIERIEGDYFTVVGLPLFRISSELCKAFNYQ
jgi:septum formation protein